MREYSVLFKDGLAVGLRNDDRRAKNSQALVISEGAYPELESLHTVEEYEEYDFSSLDCTWPFPQVFQLKEITLVCTPTSIYELIGESLSLLLGDITSGTSWSVADYWPFILMTNNSVIVTRDALSGSWSIYEGDDIPLGSCVSDINGQAFVGGTSMLKEFKPRE